MCSQYIVKFLLKTHTTWPVLCYVGHQSGQQCRRAQHWTGICWQQNSAEGRTAGLLWTLTSWDRDLDKMNITHCKLTLIYRLNLCNSERKNPECTWNWNNGNINHFFEAKCFEIHKFLLEQLCYIVVHSSEVLFFKIYSQNP